MELQALLLLTSLIELVITHSIMSHNLNTAWTCPISLLYHSQRNMGRRQFESCFLQSDLFRKTDLHIKHPDK